MEQANGDLNLLRTFIEIGEFLFKDFKFQWLVEETKSNIY